MPSRSWLEIAIERDGAEVRVRATGSRGEQTAPHSLGPEFTIDQLSLFAQQVSTAASLQQPLGDTLHQAQRLYQALFKEGVRDVMVRLGEVERGGPLLVRLMLAGDVALQAFPWEALCAPETMLGFLGNSTDVFLARGVPSKEPLPPREVRGAVRVLAIAPSGGSSFTGLQVAFAERIAAGEVEWQSPLLGPRARFSQIAAQLKRGLPPHIIHFLGHGSVDANGVPLLRMADEDGEERWIPVELLAQQLKDGFRKSLRLIVLEACEQARPGALASAAEWLVRNGADAVIAHLWPVKTDIAQVCSRVFYQTLTGAASRRGDVAFSLNEARRTVLERFQQSAEAFSPVLYLSGHDSVLFDFRVQRIAPPPPSASVPRADVPAPALEKLLRQPFTLVLGDRWKDERGVMDSFRERLRQALIQEVGSIPEGLTLTTLAQYYALHFEEQNLDREFRRVFGHAAASLPLIGVLARKLKPGVHITLQWLPVLEMALAEQRPELTLYVIQPPRPGGTLVTVMRREGGGTHWDPVLQIPEVLDPEEDLIVLRLYCGSLPPDDITRPLLTEDDYLLGLNELKTMLKPDLAASLMGTLNMRPALILGMSMLTWPHRMLLYRLFGTRPLPSGSLVVLEPGEGERELWERGRITPVRAGVQVLELSATDLMAPFSAAAQDEVRP
jgi:CHAT domain-containing protein